MNQIGFEKRNICGVNFVLVLLANLDLPGKIGDFTKSFTISFRGGTNCF